MNLLRAEEAERLQKILIKIRDEVKLLLQLENEKFTALKEVDVKELLRLNALEEEHLSVMSEYDRQRQVLIVELAEFHGLDISLSLSELVKKFPANAGLSLVELGEDIRHDTRRLDISVRENKSLIQANMEIIQMTLSYAGQEEKIGYEHSDGYSASSTLAMVNHIA